MTIACFASTVSTPLGPFSLGVDERGAVLATAFGGIDALARRRPDCELLPDTTRGAVARAQVGEYFELRRREFTVPLAAAGTEFQHRVWAVLGRIPFGVTTTYGRLAAELGSSARAVGRANATNPICLLVPCHRVVGADGSLTGFAFGEAVKRALLTHEARVCGGRTAAA